MSRSPFERINGSEPLYQSPSPVHDFEHDADSRQQYGNRPGQARYNRQSTVSSESSVQGPHPAYRATERVHTVSDFTRQPAGTETSYHAVGPEDDYSEKRPRMNRRETSSSTLSSRLLGPVFAKPWQHAHSFDVNGSGTVRDFSRARQRRRIFRSGLFQWLIPAFFCGMLILVIWWYSQKPNINRMEKYRYNALMLALTLCLGFAVQSGFKKYANLMRWRILASRYWDLKHFEMIMESSSQMAIIKLLRTGQRGQHRLSAGVRFACILYLVLALGLQVAIALIGLTVSVDTADDLTEWIPANVTVARLDAISNGNLYEDAKDDWTRQSIAAANFGGMATQFWLITDPVGKEREQPRTIFNSTDLPYYFTFFFDQCPLSDTTCGNLAAATNRWVNATSKCEELTIIDGGMANQPNITVKQGSDEWVFNVEESALSWTSTFMSNNGETCGPRCTETYVFNIGALNSTDPLKDERDEPQAFHCETEVGHVQQAPEGAAYQLPDRQARLFAGAIGWSGKRGPEDSFQVVSYPNQVWSWDGYKQTADDIARSLMIFSIGSISALDQFGNRTEVAGQSPRTPQTLNVKWRLVIAVLSVIPGVQLITLICVTIWAGAAVIPDGTYLSNARLLRPVIDKLGHNGCLLTGEEIAEELGEKGNYRVRYGALRSNDPGVSQDARYHLDLIVEERGIQPVVEKTRLFSRNMPEGLYD